MTNEAIIKNHLRSINNNLSKVVQGLKELMDLLNDNSIKSEQNSPRLTINDIYNELEQNSPRLTINDIYNELEKENEK